MTQKINIDTHVTINPNRCPMIYYPIDDADYESASFYEDNGCVVRTITLNGKPHRFALIPVKTQKQANHISREISFLQQQEQQSLKQKMDNEISYDQMIEDGYTSAINHSDPADILINLAATKALFNELGNLPEPQRCICQMIGAGMSECEMAAELGIPSVALRHCKLKLLRKLKILLKEYC